MAGQDILAAVLVAAVEMLDDDDEEQFMELMMLARIGAQLWMEMEEGEIVDENAVWEYVTVDINEYYNMRNACFKLHFRMSKEVFEALVQTIREHLIERGKLRRERTPLRDAVLMVVWLLANPDTFRSVALRFGVRPSTLYYNYSYIIEALRGMADRFISWPGPEERAQIEDVFQQSTGFPGIVGCIDGTHIFVTKPVVNGGQYKNRHHTYSYNVQAVVDCGLLVRDLHVGEVGSMNDQRVFRRSPLFRDLVQGRNRLHDNEHLVGDGAYVLTDFMLIPFPNNGHLNAHQLNYNRRLSQSRVRAENAFGRAKGKWRRLKHLYVRNEEIAADHIVACFVLHNFTILEGEQLFLGDELRRRVNENEIVDNGAGEDDPDDPDEPREVDEDDGLEGLLDVAKVRGIEKRIFVMEHLGQF